MSRILFTGGVRGEGVCMAEGQARQGDVHGSGCVVGACMALGMCGKGGMRGGGMQGGGGMHDRKNGSRSGWYASY